MLVLTRKMGEQIVIGNNVVVSIERVAGGKVKFAIQAPQEIKILRGELRSPEAKDESQSRPAAPPAPPIAAITNPVAHTACNA